MVERKRNEQELNLIETNLAVDLKARKVNFCYLIIKDPGFLSDNQRQAEAIARRQEDQLIKKESLGDYNKALQDFEDRMIIKEIGKKEMEEWKGPVNYIMHQEVLNPKLATT